MGRSDTGELLPGPDAQTLDSLKLNDAQIYSLTVNVWMRFLHLYFTTD